MMEIASPHTRSCFQGTVPFLSSSACSSRSKRSHQLKGLGLTPLKFRYNANLHASKPWTSIERLVDEIKPSCRRGLLCSASEKSDVDQDSSDNHVEIPLFPLPLILFPGTIAPLQIFEYRYRMMMHTLLQTDLRFGLIYTDPQTSALADVGCVAEVIKHERLVDDRFFIICKGQERFRVLAIVRTKPYLVAQVQWLEDKPSSEHEDVDTLANEVESYMKDVIRLSNRLNGKAEKETPEDLRKNLFPTPFSFWVASTFEGAPAEQQALLELEDTAQRLKREKETLRNTLNYLSAAAAVKDVFPSSSG
ncbi:hypothetical protein KP509_31G006800 [Ceratopteris richardii]|uniref:Lon N-terminal domain-containing protein n=3 Tax=Ceratopteris richardii TaxID=49495 RepID=A0A8T2QVK3_CERRI|nr:hypothetical protein KP509_31G006800 [Ceratopteris richardii]